MYGAHESAVAPAGVAHRRRARTVCVWLAMKLKHSLHLRAKQPRQQQKICLVYTLPFFTAAIFFFSVFLVVFFIFCFSSSGQVVDAGVVPSPPAAVLCLQFFRVHRVQQSTLLVDFPRMLLTQALALSADIFLCKRSLYVHSLCRNKKKQSLLYFRVFLSATGLRSWKGYMVARIY